MYEQQDDDYHGVQHDIIQINIKYVRQVQVVVVHVRISHRTHIIMIAEMEMLVHGYVMRDIMKMRVNVKNVQRDIDVHEGQRQHVDDDIGVKNEVQVVLK